MRVDRLALAAGAGALSTLAVRPLTVWLGEPLELPATPVISLGGIIVAVLTATILAFFAARSNWSPVKLWLGLFLITAGFEAVNLIEAVLFPLASLAQLAGMLGILCLEMAALITPIVWLAAGIGTPSVDRANAGTRRSVQWWISRLAVAGVVYTLLYFAVGIIVYPMVRDFYKPEMTPPIEWLLATQLLVRGPLIAALVALTALMVTGSRNIHAVCGALLLVGFGAIVLIAPNPLLPASVRFVHFFEVAVSNGIFGFLMGRMFSPAEKALAKPTTHCMRSPWGELPASREWHRPSQTPKVFS